MNIQAQRDFIDRRQLVSALRALRRGDFSVRLPEEVEGVDGEIASLFNEVVSLNEEMTQEFERLSKVVGKGTLSGGSTTVKLKKLGKGKHKLTVVYAGSSNVNGAKSGKVTLTVKK